MHPETKALLDLWEDFPHFKPSNLAFIPGDADNLTSRLHMWLIKNVGTFSADEGSGTSIPLQIAFNYLRQDAFKWVDSYGIPFQIKITPRTGITEDLFCVTAIGAKRGVVQEINGFGKTELIAFIDMCRAVYTD